MIGLVNEWGKSNKQNDLIFKIRKNEDFSWNDDDMDLIADNAKELPSAPFSDISAGMSGVKVECEQGVSAVEEPRVPSEDEELATCVDNANVGLQERIENESETSIGHTMGNIMYNINVDVANAQPAMNFEEEEDTTEAAHDSDEKVHLKMYQRETHM